jgi:hypothetical protein
LGMLTPFKLALRASGPEADRQLFWETVSSDNYN